MIWLSQNLRSICEAKSWIIVIYTQMTTWAVGPLVSRWGLGSWFSRHTSGSSSWCSQPVSSPLPTPCPKPGLVYVTLGSSTLCNFKVRSQETLLPHLSHSLVCSPHTSNPHSGGKQLAGPMEPWEGPRWWGPEAFVQKPENSYQQWCELEISTPALWSFQTTSTALNSLSVSTGEKRHNQKVENYVLFGRHPDDVSLGQPSQITLGDLFKEAREKPGYIGAFTTNTR